MDFNVGFWRPCSMAAKNASSFGVGLLRSLVPVPSSRIAHVPRDRPVGRGLSRSVATLVLVAACACGVSCTPREQSVASAAPAAMTTASASPSDARGATSPSPAASGRATANAPAARRYPLTTCAINGREFGDSPKHRRVHQGQEVLFCCTPCVRAFDTAPEAFMPTILARIDAHEAATNQAPASPPLAAISPQSGL